MPDHHSIAGIVAPFLEDPAGCALLLDLDGTLAPIVPDPHAVAIPAGIRAALPVLRERFGLLAFISGRSLTELERIVGMSGVAYSGNHGIEVRDRDLRRLPAPSPPVGPLRAFVESCAALDLEGAGVWLEDKRFTLTFHYRNAPDPVHAQRLLAEAVAPAAAAAGLRVEPGRMSLEVHPAGSASKGTAAAAVLDAHPEARRVLSLGDDRTDTTVWAMLHRRLAAGDLTHALAVGIASAETPEVVRRHADVMVDGVAGSEAILTTLADAAPR